MNKCASDAFLNDLKALCEFLDRQPRKSCYRDFTPESLRYVLSPEFKGEREGVLFYSSGWGWRLRKDWQAELEKRGAPKQALKQYRVFVCRCDEFMCGCDQDGFDYLAVNRVAAAEEFATQFNAFDRHVVVESTSTDRVTVAFNGKEGFLT